ncbi:hypothetical protein MRX96_051352 [Rhipicephalus microplus]
MTADFATNTHVDTRNRDTECRSAPYASVRMDSRVDGYALKRLLSYGGSKPTATHSLSHIRDSGVATALLAPTPFSVGAQTRRRHQLLRFGGLRVDGVVGYLAKLMRACVMTGSVCASRKCECLRLGDAIDSALLVVDFDGVFYNRFVRRRGVPWIITCFHIMSPF